jgi:hypothetical protein
MVEYRSLKRRKLKSRKERNKNELLKTILNIDNTNIKLVNLSQPSKRPHTYRKQMIKTAKHSKRNNLMSNNSKLEESHCQRLANTAIVLKSVNSSLSTRTREFNSELAESLTKLE